MHKKRIINYDENIRSKAITLQLLADREAAIRASIEVSRKQINKRVNLTKKVNVINITSEKRERFKRLANNRLRNILKQLKLLSNLSNRSHYDFSQSQIDYLKQICKNTVKVNIGKFSK